MDGSSLVTAPRLAAARTHHFGDVLRGARGGLPVGPLEARRDARPHLFEQQTAHDVAPASGRISRRTVRPPHAVGAHGGHVEAEHLAAVGGQEVGGDVDAVQRGPHHAPRPPRGDPVGEAVDHCKRPIGAPAARPLTLLVVGQHSRGHRPLAAYGQPAGGRDGHQSAVARVHRHQREGAAHAARHDPLHERAQLVGGHACNEKRVSEWTRREDAPTERQTGSRSAATPHRKSTSAPASDSSARSTRRRRFTCGTSSSQTSGRAPENGRRRSHAAERRASIRAVSAE